MARVVGKREYSDEEWDEAKSVGHRFLLKNAASVRQTVVYSQFAPYVQAMSKVVFPGEHFDGVGDLLGDISRDAINRKQPPISALVVYANGMHRGTPGPGFYKLLSEPDFVNYMGEHHLEASSSPKNWRAIRDLVWDFWGETTWVDFSTRPLGSTETTDYELRCEDQVAVATLTEKQLILDYAKFRYGTNQERLMVGIMRPKGEGLLVVDGYDEIQNILIEAKSSTSRQDVRMAIGQLLDYKRFINPTPELVVLLPDVPRPEIERLCDSVEVALAWRSKDGAFRDNRNGMYSTPTSSQGMA